MQPVGRISGKEIDGLADTIALLNKFDKDGLKVMNKEIYQVVKKIQLSLIQNSENIRAQSLRIFM